MKPAVKSAEPVILCARCGKPEAYCVCASIKPVNNDISVVVLRHPQEKDEILGTASILTETLDNSLLKTGLSWPNLAKAIGQNADPKRWGVLFLGTSKATQPMPKQILTAISSKGNPLPDQEDILGKLEGIILLDGSWAQAKALWWRNAWLLKCRRLVLQPPKPSLYGNLRKEPRRESVSTLEAAAFSLAYLENKPELEADITAPFKALLDKVRANKAAPKIA